MSAITFTREASPFPGGDVGGDAQAGDSLMVRFVGSNEHRPALIDVYAYASFVDINDQDPAQGYRAQLMIEYRRVGDVSQPGDSEVWSGSAYHTDPRVFPVLDEATLLAHALLHTFDPESSFEGAYTWNGLAEWETL
jgi:hypothetical protein